VATSACASDLNVKWLMMRVAVAVLFPSDLVASIRHMH
jgi:hypothetical protein